MVSIRSQAHAKISGRIAKRLGSGIDAAASNMFLGREEGCLAYRTERAVDKRTGPIPSTTLRPRARSRRHYAQARRRTLNPVWAGHSSSIRISLGCVAKAERVVGGARRQFRAAPYLCGAASVEAPGVVTRRANAEMSTSEGAPPRSMRDNEVMVAP
jgi:hypothetical protein